MKYAATQLLIKFSRFFVSLSVLLVKYKKKYKKMKAINEQSADVKHSIKSTFLQANNIFVEN